MAGQKSRSQIHTPHFAGIHHRRNRQQRVHENGKAYARGSNKASDALEWRSNLFEDQFVIVEIVCLIVLCILLAHCSHEVRIVLILSVYVSLATRRPIDCNRALVLYRSLQLK